MPEPDHSYQAGSEASKDRTNRYPTDQMLRRAGFRIYSRPDKGPILWEKNGRVVQENIAVDIALRLENKERQ